MTPDVISSLVNLGSAGAVIAVVIVFLKAMDRRDDMFQKSLQEQATQWRSFFTVLNDGNKDDVCKIADTLEAVAGIVHMMDTKLDRQMADLKAHDDRVDARIKASAAIATRPFRKKPNGE